MIECESCKNWLHLKCIGVTKKQLKNIKKFSCERCLKKEQTNSTKQSQEVKLKLNHLNFFKKRRLNNVQLVKSVQKKKQ